MSLFDFGPLTGAGLFNGKVLDAMECSLLFRNIENPPPFDVFGQFSSVVGASKEFFQRLKASSLEGCRITAFPSPAGRTLLCIAVQFDEFQSRLLFDLKLPRTRLMLQAAKKTGEIRFMYFLDGGSEALGCGVGIAAGVVDDLLSLELGNADALSDGEILAETAFVAVYLLKEREALLVTGWPMPQEITVTDTITKEVLNGAEARNHRQ